MNDWGGAGTQRSITMSTRTSTMRSSIICTLSQISLRGTITVRWAVHVAHIGKWKKWELEISHEVKLSRYSSCRRQGGEKMLLLLILDLGTRWGEWSASRPGRALLSGKDTCTHCVGGWVGLRAVLDTQARGKCFVFGVDRTPVVQSIVRHCTEISISLHTKYWRESLQGRDNSEDLGVDGRILKLILEK
jgi:hypothetical protein